MRTKILLGTLVSFLGVLNAQNEVLTKVDGGASWLTGSGGIYSGDGETPSDVDVTVTDHIDFDAGTLFIDGEDHRIGIGTTDPLFDLQIDDIGSNGNMAIRTFWDNAVGSALVFDKSRYTGGSASDVQSGDALGRIIFRGRTGGTSPVYNESARIEAAVVGTPSSTRAPADLRFSTATTGNLMQRMVLESGGNVGIGITNPSHMLQLGSDDGAKPGGGSWTNSSDIRLKNIDGPYRRGLLDIIQLNPVSYHYKNVEDKIWNEDVLAEQFHGFVAQELQEVYPECIKEDEDGYLTVNVSALNVSYVNAIKELNQMNTKLQAENKQIRAELDLIKKALEERSSD